MLRLSHEASAQADAVPGGGPVQDNKVRPSHDRRYDRKGECSLIRMTNCPSTIF